MAALSSGQLPVDGLGRPVQHQFLRQEHETEHLALLLPGLGYNFHRPYLYYPALMLQDAGADVLLADYRYREQPDFQKLDWSGQVEWIQADVLALLEAGLSQRTYSRLTLIGKSIGTIGLARLLATRPIDQQMQIIWLTPLIQDDTVNQQVGRFARHSLLVIGTADPFYEPAKMAKLAQNPELEVIYVEEGDHSLNVAYNALRSIQLLEAVMERVSERIGRQA